METIDWKKRAESLLQLLNHKNKLYNNKIHEIMLMFEDVHIDACEKQKIICAEYAESKLVYYSPTEDPHDEVDKNSILNSPTAKFE